MITMIPRSRLEPHPDNPRKDLGDLTELAASIKRSGLLQNLTVVPHPEKPDIYRIIIGHRRFAASKIAGLDELPCSIEEMDMPTQIATMLAENLQRNDLTIADQVGGVQMMMDLGESVQAIATKTGLSETSVRKRVTLSSLPQSEMRVAVDKGATLLDLMKVMELEDPDERENVLKEFGTNNWQYSLNAAKGRQEQKAFRAKIMPWLEEHKIKTTKNSSEVYGPKYKYVTQWSRNSTEEPTFPTLEEGKHYVYVDSSWSVTLYVRDDEYIGQQEESKKADRIRKVMKEKGQELNRQAYELRCAFVRKYRCNDAKRKVFWEKLFGFIVAQRGYSGWSELASYHNWSMNNIRDMLAIDGLGCFTTHQHPCQDCPFNPHPGMTWVYGCIKGQNDIVDAAREVLRKYQEVTDHGEGIDGGPGSQAAGDVEGDDTRQGQTRLSHADVLLRA